jgi:UPF0755 protein
MRLALTSSLSLSVSLLACSGPTGPLERVTIPSGASFATAADSLEAHGLIRWRPWFTAVARLGRFDRAIKPGVYQFAPGASALDILRDLRDGRFLTIKVTIPEGFTLIDVAARLSDSLGVPRDSALAAARDPAVRKRYGVEAPSLEGYLAPDTYTLPAHYSARDAVETMAAQARTGWTEALDANARAQGLTRHQVVTLASIVEGEAAVDEERAVIAAVYRNRLRLRMPLQADPTVQYAIQLATGARKPRLFNRDYRFPSPYNTYLVAGLPPGPVGAPSRASIEAVLSPAEVPYLYFVGTGDGRHVFTTTYREHLRTIARIRR